MAREVTNKIWEAIDEGLLSAEEVLEAVLKWISEWDVQEINKFYEWVEV